VPGALGSFAEDDPGDGGENLHGHLLACSSAGGGREHQQLGDGHHGRGGGGDIYGPHRIDAMGQRKNWTSFRVYFGSDAQRTSSGPG